VDLLKVQISLINKEYIPILMGKKRGGASEDPVGNFQDPKQDGEEKNHIQKFPEKGWKKGKEKKNLVSIRLS